MAGTAHSGSRLGSPSRPAERRCRAYRRPGRV